MKLILVRHGNTFAAGDKVVWVGANSDMPLVEKGQEQAKALGTAFMRMNLRPDAIICGPLKRHIQTAEIAAQEAGYPENIVTIDKRLNEIDYGPWEGCSNDEIRALHGSQDIDRWQKQSIWPKAFGWSPDPEKIAQDWQELVSDLENRFDEQSTVILVTSNGAIRILGPILGIEPENAKVLTGHMCIFYKHKGGNYTLETWNKNPQEVLAML